jgi:glycosyltransferase involved in cell wall biosynthesis
MVLPKHELHAGQSATDRPLVAVVTPFHNTADYLEQCIKSVLAQTYEHFEYLLCDNCSSDGSTEIARAFAESDPRVRYIRFEELIPQVPNYNRALEQMSASAEWCKIVQADDWLREQCLERMVEAANLDVRIGLVASYYLKGNEVRGYGLPTEQQVFDGRSACCYQLRQKFYFMGSPSTLLYRADIVRSRQPFYALHRFNEDTEAAYEILERSHLGFVHEILSVLRVDNPSIMASLERFNPEVLNTWVVLERYGDRFLPPKESHFRRSVAKAKYFLFLGQSALKMRPRAFWDYHKSELDVMGWSWSWTSVFVWSLVAAATLLLNPLSTATEIVRHLRDRLPGQ